MKCLTIMFSHLPYDEMIKHFNWTADKVENLRCIWDINDINPTEIGKNDKKEIMPMKLQNLRANISKYYTHAITLFQQEDPEYFMFLEADVAIIEKGFDAKCVDYMKRKEIQVMVPWLKNQWNSPGHPFLESLRAITPKFWCITALSLFSKQALDYYGQSMIHVPMYWDEIRLPSLMVQGSWNVCPNPFLNEKNFHHIKSDPNNKPASSLPIENIKDAIENKDGAVHPIKDFSLFDTIEKIKKGENV